MEWSIRLRDGIVPLEGKVEIFIEDSWQVVIDNDWDLVDAHVVCRQLGFSQAKVGKVIMYTLIELIILSANTYNIIYYRWL